MNKIIFYTLSFSLLISLCNHITLSPASAMKKSTQPTTDFEKEKQIRSPLSPYTTEQTKEIIKAWGLTPSTPPSSTNSGSSNNDSK